LAPVLTLVAIAADQFAAPILWNTAPLWATAVCLLLVWRRARSPIILGEGPNDRVLLPRRLAAFVAAHLVIVLVARLLTSVFQPVAGTTTVGGTLIAAWKLFVFAPTFLLFRLSRWRQLIRAYGPEVKAFLVVSFTFISKRALAALWPWYGQALGRLVYLLAGFFVPGLGYEQSLNPVVTGPDEDITIVLACSGITGFELFAYLFGFVAVLDWNLLRKGRALIIYSAGLFTMLVGNVLRIATLVILGNRGFADFASRFHYSAGWIFFSAIFLIYLSLTYSWMLKRQDPALGLEQGHYASPVSPTEKYVQSG
jgi:exosortase/archaeosortase family protein